MSEWRLMLKALRGGWPGFLFLLFWLWIAFEVSSK